MGALACVTCQGTSPGCPRNLTSCELHACMPALLQMTACTIEVDGSTQAALLLQHVPLPGPSPTPRLSSKTQLEWPSKALSRPATPSAAHSSGVAHAPVASTAATQPSALDATALESLPVALTVIELRMWDAGAAGGGAAAGGACLRLQQVGAVLYQNPRARGQMVSIDLHSLQLCCPTAASFPQCTAASSTSR